MSAIGPGDWLECTKASSVDGGAISIQLGCVYQCSGFRRASPATAYWHCVWCGLDAEHMPTLHGKGGVPWCPCCFKPAGYRPTEEIQRLLKAPTKVREDA